MAVTVAPGRGFELRAVGTRADDHQVLRSIDLELPVDGITVVAGPSGSGKSSLLRLLNRVDVPSDGRITFDGVDLGVIDTCALRRTVGFVVQHPVAVAGTVADNLRVADGALDDADVDRLLERVGLGGFAGRDAETLSGGEAQRMNVARTLATRPRVVLADEPTSSLDADAERTLEALARTTAESSGADRIGWIWVSHDRDQIRRLADRLVVLVDGRVVAAGSPAQLRSHASPHVQAIVGSSGPVARRRSRAPW